jgi:hypothetical protein
VSPELAAAFRTLRALAFPLRLRVTTDPQGFPMVAGRLGQIEWHCDGQDCHGCPRSGLLLAVYTARRRMMPKLQQVPGVIAWQIGDEARYLFPVGALAAVAETIRARRRAVRVMTPERLAALAAGREKAREGYPRATSRTQDRVRAERQGAGTGNPQREGRRP